eukprot:jgi/Botrbrau1/4618/Bobra.60_2s0101.1
MRISCAQPLSGPAFLLSTTDFERRSFLSSASSSAPFVAEAETFAGDRGCAMEPGIFRPADGYEIADSAAILSLGGTRHKNILLSPAELSQLTLEEVEGIIAEYGEAFDTCIDEAMDGHDPDVIGSTTELVNEITAFLSIIEALQPEACNWWTDTASNNIESDKPWSALLDDLDLSSEQAHLLVRLYFKMKNSLYTLATDRASALITAQQESFTERGTGETVKELLQAAQSHRKLVLRMQESLHSLNSSLSNLRDEVMRKVLHPLQAAMMYKAFSPRPPNTLLMLEELRNRHSARISQDVALWSRERDTERPWSGPSSSPRQFSSSPATSGGSYRGPRIGEISTAPCGRQEVHKEGRQSTAPCGRQELHKSRSMKYMPSFD